MMLLLWAREKSEKNNGKLKNRIIAQVTFFLLENTIEDGVCQFQERFTKNHSEVKDKKVTILFSHTNT